MRTATAGKRATGEAAGRGTWRAAQAPAPPRGARRGAAAKPAAAAPSVRGRSFAAPRPAADRASTAAGQAQTPAAPTIGALAQAAGVHVETVRYYQRRGLLPQPPRQRGSYRRYPPDAAARLRFIRHAQKLGFTLDEVAELLQLADGSDRAAIRRVAAARVAQLRQRIADMQAMAGVLDGLIAACAHDGAAPCCPIIESIAAPLPDEAGGGIRAMARPR